LEQPTGNVTITAFNVRNLFDTVNDPAKDDDVLSPSALDVKLTKLALALELELELPGIRRAGG
jgi:hypothetical protein